jgi:hypothetical protein
MTFRSDRSGPEFLTQLRNIQSDAVGAHSSSYIVRQMIPAYRFCQEEAGTLCLLNDKSAFSTNTPRIWKRLQTQDAYETAYFKREFRQWIWQNYQGGDV